MLAHFKKFELLSELERIRYESVEVSTVSDALTEILKSQDIPVGALNDKTTLNALRRVVLVSAKKSLDEDSEDQQVLCHKMQDSAISTSEARSSPETNNKCKLYISPRIRLRSFPLI